jgi:hypothetical protein
VGTRSSRSRASSPVPCFFKELTAKSAVRLLLGLAIWFSKTEPSCTSCGLCATLAASSRVFFNRGAESFIRGRFFCQAPLRSPASSPRFPAPRQCFGAFLRGGAASTSAPRSLSTVPFPALFFCPPPDCFFRPVGRGFYHRRVGSQPPSSTPYFRCQPALGFPQVGRGFYHRRVLCQPSD